MFCDSNRAFEAAVRYRPEILPAYLEDMAKGQTSAGPYMQQKAAQWVIKHPQPGESQKQHAARVERMLREPHIPAVFLDELVSQGARMPDKWR